MYVPQQELSTDESLVGAKARAVMTQYIPSPLMNHWSEQRQGQLWRNTYHLHWWIIGRSKGKVSYDVIHTNQKPQIWCTTLVEADIGYILHILPDSGRRYDPVSVGDKGVMLLLQLIICINGIIYSVITILHTNVYKYYKPSS